MFTPMIQCTGAWGKDEMVSESRERERERVCEVVGGHKNTQGFAECDSLGGRVSGVTC